MADQRIVLQCHNWMGIPHQKLYDDIHAGSGTAAVEPAQAFYQRMQVDYAAIFATLQGGLTRLAQAHEGAAADASQAAVSVFGNWVDDATAVAGDDHSGVSTFSTSYAFAKNDMPPPVQVNAVDSAWDDVKDFFGGTTAREAQEQAAHDEHAKAAQVMTTFFDSGAGAANQMPYWTAPQQVALDVPVPPPSGSGGVAEGGGVASSIAGGGAGNGSGGGVDAGAGRVAPLPEVTSPVSTAPAAATLGPAGPGTPVAPVATAPAGSAGTVVPPGGLAPGAAGRGGLPGAGPGGAGGIGAGRAGGGRGAGGVGGIGGRTGGVGGAAGGVGRVAGGAASGSGAARSASGGATSNAAGTAARGAAGAAGRPGMGMGMAPMMGGVGGRGSDETEHQRKFPLEDDLFADERRVAPPVIGVDPED